MNQVKKKGFQTYIYSIILLSLFSFTFGKFAYELRENELHKFDLTIIQWIQGWISNDLTTIMSIITFMGSRKAIIGILIISMIVMFLNNKRWETLFLITAISGSALFNLLLKWIFHRVRPTIHPLIKETGYSFPSGHSMSSFVFYGMLAYFIILFVEKKLAKVVTGIFFGSLVLAIGISRIYLGVHYPSDVLAGFAAGGVWLIICLLALRYILEKRKDAKRRQKSNT